MSDLTGVWRLWGDVVNETMVIGDDTLVVGRQCFSWKEDGDRLFILPAEAKIVVPYRIDGDVLQLDVDGVVSIWARVAHV